MRDALYQAREIVVSYNQVVALDRLSIDVARGERLALLGANGSGKSTLLRVLDCLLFPQAGSLFFDGEPITESDFVSRDFTFKFRRRVGFVFQNPDVQLFNPTVFDEIAFGPLQLRWPKELIRERVEASLRQMDIHHLRNRTPHQLSGGEKKRVAIASVMILDPEILLLDEPATALDPKSQSQIVDLLVSWGGRKKTVVIATHDLDSLEDISDRCAVFEKGKIIAEGPPLQILHDVKLLQAARLISAHRHSHDETGTAAHPHLHREK